MRKACISVQGTDVLMGDVREERKGEFTGCTQTNVEL